MSDLAVVQQAKAVQKILLTNKDSFASKVPSGIICERTAAVAYQLISASDKLQNCSKESLVGSVMQASMMGLELHGALGHAYLVPFGNQATLLPGYRGMVLMARQTSVEPILDLFAEVVYAKDTFEHSLAPRELTHKPPAKKGKNDRGDAMFVYAYVRYVNGAVDFEVMDIAEIDEIKKKAHGSKNADSPWVIYQDEMRRKTALKRLIKRIPMTGRMADALELENTVSGGQYVDTTGAIDVAGIHVPADAPTSVMEQPQAASTTRKVLNAPQVTDTAPAPAPAPAVPAVPAVPPIQPAPPPDVILATSQPPVHAPPSNQPIPANAAGGAIGFEAPASDGQQPAPAAQTQPAGWADKFAVMCSSQGYNPATVEHFLKHTQSSANNQHYLKLSQTMIHLSEDSAQHLVMNGEKFCERYEDWCTRQGFEPHYPAPA
ncbi:recombinase RecT [Pararhizobium sp.]|uniref:recombinase RecT n=1 Tax=Pararhizobium sp. TaxID=1977563 RepID=UPI003D138BDC